MKILYARNADFDFPEANKVQVANMCKGFKESGCEITLIAFGKNIQEIRRKYHLDKIKTYFLKRKIRFFVLGDILLFCYFITNHKKHQYIYTRDIIIAALIKIFFKKKIVFFETHNIPKKIWWKYIFKKFIPKFDKTIVISEGLREGLSKIGVKTDNMIVLHDAVDLKEFDIPLSKKEARYKLGLPQDKKIISYIGSTKKDHDIKAFINAAAAIKEAHFLVFGKPEEYLKQADAVLENFEFKGYIDNPAIAYKASDILFAGYTKKVPWIKYMSPLKIFEYMVSKRPMIVANFPRTREILNDNEAYFYRSGHSKEIIKNIKKILENKKEVQEKIANAFEKGKNCTWEKRTEIIVGLIGKQSQ